MCARVRWADDHGVLTAAAVLASLIVALLVELRHRDLRVAVEVDPSAARQRRTQFLLETGALTGPALALLALSGSALH